jgi:hypothetical protein
MTKACQMPTGNGRGWRFRVSTPSLQNICQGSRQNICQGSRMIASRYGAGSWKAALVDLKLQWYRQIVAVPVESQGHHALV